MAQNQTPVERVDVWQCIGCGKIEAPQPCLGVCRDRKAELVYAEDYDALLAETDALRAVLRQIASITPHEGECARTWQALQARARAALAVGKRHRGEQRT